MYSLDINFLKDRPDYKKDLPKIKVKKGPAIEDPKPIFIGAGAAIAVNCVAFGALLYMGHVTANLEEDLAEKNAQLSKLTAEVKDIEAIKTKAKTFKEEADALATVFNDIKPWSALLGELGALMPSGVKIARIEQKEEKGKAPPPPAKGKEAPPAPKQLLFYLFLVRLTLMERLTTFCCCWNVLPSLRKERLSYWVRLKKLTQLGWP
jgi:type IV pilus assembly protein PilN